MERLIARFPEHAPAVRARFREDPSFRETGGDYAGALQALQRWQASEVPQKAARIEQYRELAEASESEIATALRLPPLTWRT